MRTYPECFVCLTRLTQKTIEDQNWDLDKQVEVMRKALRIIQVSDHHLPPPLIARKIYDILLDLTGEEDLYRDFKSRSTLNSLDLYPRLKEVVASSGNRLDTALRISALGNLMDAANPHSFDLNQEVDRIMSLEIRGGGLNEFKARLNGASELLMLGDNAGETVFDRVLIEELDVPVIYVVKDGPAYNDVNYQDAQDAGLDKIATIISNGSDIPGTYLPDCSQEFLELFSKSDLILAKGQGNYETMSDQGDKIFYLMKIKCGSVAQDINLPFGSIVLKQGEDLVSAPH